MKESKTIAELVAEARQHAKAAAVALSQVKMDGVVLTSEQTRDVNAAFDVFDAAHRQTRRAFNEPDDPLEAVKTDD